MSEQHIIVQSRANKVIDLADRKITVTSSATIWESPAGGRVEDVFIAVELSGSRDHKFEFHLWSFPHMFLHETPEGWQKAVDKLARDGLQEFVNLIASSLKPDPYKTITQKMLEAFVQPEFSTSEELYWLCEVGKAADALWWIKFYVEYALTYYCIHLDDFIPKLQSDEPVIDIRNLPQFRPIPMPRKEETVGAPASLPSASLSFPHFLCQTCSKPKRLETP